MRIKKIEKIPDKIFNDLKLVIHDKSVEHNSYLAGNIEQEYWLGKQIATLEKYLLDVETSAYTLNYYIDFYLDTEYENVCLL